MTQKPKKQIMKATSESILALPTSSYARYFLLEVFSVLHKMAPQGHTKGVGVTMELKLTVNGVDLPLDKILKTGDVEDARIDELMDAEVLKKAQKLLETSVGNIMDNMTQIEELSAEVVDNATKAIDLPDEYWSTLYSELRSTAPVPEGLTPKKR